MKKNAVYKNEKNEPAVVDEVLKATALLYLEEALLKQKYEDCAELIRIAKGFGAAQNEVSGVLTAGNRGLRAARVNEAERVVGGRLRFY